jgi:hypothetical protein
MLEPVFLATAHFEQPEFCNAHVGREAGLTGPDDRPEAYPTLLF